MTREEMKNKAMDLILYWSLIMILFWSIVISYSCGYTSVHSAALQCGVIFMIEVAYTIGLIIKINEDGESWFNLAFEVIEENK